MIISKITFGQNYSYNQNKIKEEKTNDLNKRQEFPMPNSSHYAHLISFTGGKSLNLAETCKSLLTKEDCPPLVWERAQEILVEGNPENKTLIDVHKEVYGDLLLIDDIEMLKTFFPQFRDVKSSFEIEQPRVGSFLDKVKKGELEHFNPENDTTLDLIKLLYAEGFSTNDLKEYCDGKSIYSTVTQNLNIPLLSPKYARILKLSDPVFNERLTSAISNTRILNKDRAAQSDEPVYIPSKRVRGGKPLSEEHKVHISESLREYWENNPERASELSERQKEYFEENPEQKELFSRVLIKTWGRSPSIKKALSKHFRKNNVEVPNDKDFAFNLSPEQKNLLKTFWERNDWAKKEFSKNMKAAWINVKREVEQEKTEGSSKVDKSSQGKRSGQYKCMPKSFIRDLIKLAKERDGITLSEDDFVSFLEPDSLNLGAGNLYFSSTLSGESGNILADIYSLTLADFTDYATHHKDNKIRQIGFDIFSTYRQMTDHDRFDEANNFLRVGEISINEVLNLFCNVYRKCEETQDKALTRYLEDKLESKYVEITKKRKIY